MAEAPLDDPDELLHRQVHPSFVQHGRVGSQAFRPTQKDEGKLSISRGSCCTAEQAFLLYTRDRDLASAGVWSVTVAECRTLDLAAHAEPLDEPVVDDAHGFIDFRGLSGTLVTRLAKRLASLARDRGCQHP